jgi:hypothetical protein
LRESWALGRCQLDTKARGIANSSLRCESYTNPTRHNFFHLAT